MSAFYTFLDQDLSAWATNHEWTRRFGLIRVDSRFLLVGATHRCNLEGNADCGSRIAEDVASDSEIGVWLVR
jgi:hypothetical protein